MSEIWDKRKVWEYVTKSALGFIDGVEYDDNEAKAYHLAYRAGYFHGQDGLD